MKKILYIILLLIIISIPIGCPKKTPSITDLPDVLIIGDSIAKGYAPYLIQALKNKADVQFIHSPDNARSTWHGLKYIDNWIGDTDWDVIQFNWGLWDLNHFRTDPENPYNPNNKDKIKGKRVTTLNQYEKNLEKLVTRLKKTNAKLIWANITYIPENEPGRIVGDDMKYNNVAAKIMNNNIIEINDLYSVTKDFPPHLYKGPGDVHHTTEGRQLLAQVVANEILMSINTKQ